MQYDLYYYIPWPDSQKLYDLEPDQYHWSYSDARCHEFGCFAEKEWFDKVSKDGL